MYTFVAFSLCFETTPNHKIEFHVISNDVEFCWWTFFHNYIAVHTSSARLHSFPSWSAAHLSNNMMLRYAALQERRWWTSLSSDLGHRSSWVSPFSSSIKTGSPKQVSRSWQLNCNVPELTYNKMTLISSNDPNTVPSLIHLLYESWSKKHNLQTTLKIQGEGASLRYQKISRKVNAVRSTSNKSVLGYIRKYTDVVVH